MKPGTVFNMLVIAILLVPIIAFAQSYDGVTGAIVTIGLLIVFFRLCWLVFINTIQVKDIEHLEGVVSRITTEKSKLLDQLYHLLPKGECNENEKRLEEEETGGSGAEV